MHEVRAVKNQQSAAKREELERLAAAKEEDPELRAKFEKEALRMAKSRIVQKPPASTGLPKPKKTSRVVYKPESEESEQSEESDDSSSEEEIVIRTKKRHSRVAVRSESPVSYGSPVAQLAARTKPAPKAPRAKQVAPAQAPVQSQEVVPAQSRPPGFAGRQYSLH